MIRFVLLLSISLTGLVPAVEIVAIQSVAAQEPDSKIRSWSHAVRDRAISAAAEARMDERVVVTGQDEWLLFAPELRALTAGPFWGAAATEVGRALRPQDRDPLPAIVDFHQQLKAAGIELLLVPVPAKLSVYPESLVTPPEPGLLESLPRIDRDHAAFYEQLRRAGVTVLDPLPEFLKHRRTDPSPLYCRTDTHWTPRAAELVAVLLRRQLAQRSWLEAIPRQRFDVRSDTIEITGDLAALMDSDQPAVETVARRLIGRLNADRFEPVAEDRDSPVLLIGDSHTLVFHDQELHGTGAGLPDQLAAELGFGIDVIGIRGSAATAARIELVRRRDNLAGKRLVIWCFSMREFTESLTGWRTFPVIRR